MKTTLELPDDLFRSAKIAAAQQGRSLKHLFTEALREKLKGPKPEARLIEAPWMKLFGTFGKSHADSRRIQAAVDAEFGQIDPLE
jgi:hypothetical protein